MATTHTVEQGQTVSRIARAHGHANWRAVWQHPYNAELRRARRDPNVLMQGDELFVPDPEPARFDVCTGAVHRFVARRPTAALRIHLRDEGEHGDPLADLRFELTVGGMVIAGRTAPDGVLLAELPYEVAGEDRGALKVWLSEEEEPFEWDLHIGHLDPIDTASGMWARLENLAFDCGDDRGGGGEDTERALRAFADAIRLPGDEQERAERALQELVRAHGC